VTLHRIICRMHVLNLALKFKAEVGIPWFPISHLDLYDFGFGDLMVEVHLISPRDRMQKEKTTIQQNDHHSLLQQYTRPKHWKLIGRRS